MHYFYSNRVFLPIATEKQEEEKEEDTNKEKAQLEPELAPEDDDDKTIY